jgi:tetratricopeptide (TPR) repeat protein
MVEDFANSPTMVTVYKDGKKVASTLEDGAEIYGKELNIFCLGDRIRLSSGIPYRTGSARLLLALKKGTLEILHTDVDQGWPIHCDDPGICSDPEPSRKQLAEAAKALKQLKKVHQESLALFRAKKTDEAVKRLETILTRYPAAPGQNDRGLEVKAPVDQDLPEVVALENDYAFFLAEIGQTKDAAAFLRNLVLNHAERSVAHLNLADVLWDLGIKAEAEAEYYEYGSRVPRAKWPSRVVERCPLCVE